MGQNVYYGSALGELEATAAPYSADPTGVSDSAPAVQSMLNDGTGMLPPGTYKFGSQIRLPQGRRLRGIPGQTRIIQAAGANLNGMIVTGNIVGGVLQFIDWENVYVEDLIIDGNGANQTLGAVSQPNMALYGSDIHVRRVRFQNCGTSAASAAAQNGTGLIIGSSLENPPSAARLSANDLEFVNCTGVPSWLTNAKGGFVIGGPNPDVYGLPGLSNVSRQVFYNCDVGLYIEDRSSGWEAEEIQFFGNPNTYLTRGGNAVNVIYSGNGKLSVRAKYCASALFVNGGTPGASGSFAPAENLRFKVFAENCWNAGVRLTGTPAVAATITSNVGLTNSLPLTVTTGATTICANAWLLILDGAATEWVQASGPIAGGNVPLYNATLNAHGAGAVVISDTGLRHAQGDVIARDCGSVNDTAGVLVQAAYDMDLRVTAYDTRQYLAGLGTPAIGSTQKYGVKVTGACKRVKISGLCGYNTETAVYDDGTNTDVNYEAFVPFNVNDNGTRQFVRATLYSNDPNTPSKYYGATAPANTQGKNGDEFMLKNAAGNTRYQRIAGAWKGMLWTAAGNQAPPTVPVSGTPIGNTFGFPVDVFIYNGTVTNVSRNGVQVASATNTAIHLEPGDNIILSYTVAPQWAWFGGGT